MGNEVGDLPKVVRNCGPSERMSTAWHELRLYFRISNTTTFTIPKAKFGDGGRRTASRLIRTAVAQVMLAQPVMRVGIIGEDSKDAQFVALTHVDLSKQVEDAEAPSLRAVASSLEETLLQRWPDLATRPGWHVRIFHEPGSESKDTYRFRISFTVHHAICDGISTGMFQLYLLDALNKPDPAVALRMEELGDSAIIKLADDLDYPPPQENLIRFTSDLSWKASKIWNSLAPPILKPFETQTWAGKPHDPVIKAVHVRYMALGSATTEAVARKCREENTTVTNLLNALCATSLARRVPANAMAKGEGFVASTPISLRPWIPEESGFNKGRMSVCVTGYDQEFGYDVLAKLRQDAGQMDARVWELAADLRADMKRKTKAMPRNDISSLAAHAGDWRDVFQSRYGKPRRELWSVSNLGSIPTARQGPWDIESVMFAQLYPVISCALAVGVASVEGGEMVASFVWQDGILEEELVVGLRDDLEKWLISLGKEGKFRTERI